MDFGSSSIPKFKRNNARIINTMLKFYRHVFTNKKIFENFRKSEGMFGPGSHVKFSVVKKITQLVDIHPMKSII